MHRAGIKGGRKKPLLLLLAIQLFLFSALSATAQFDTGTISGTVVDNSGAVIPSATVTVSNTGTGQTVTLTTNGAGAFSASDLPFGSYTATATATSFGSATSRNIVLNVGAAVHVTMKLSAAATAETVTVTGTETAVNTETTVSGETFNSKQIENLPVNGRDVADFLEISPGSVGSAPEFQGSVNGLENIFSGLNITVDGQSAVRGDITGFLNTEGQEQPHITRSSIDSIQEIDFANNGYSAETGHSLGPQMNIITKGGTNQLHGTAFEFFRNDALDAHDYFEHGRKQPLKLNQFGGNLSGPVVHNNLFFFVNYEGTRQHLTTISPLNHTVSAYVRSQFVPAMQPVLAQLAPLPAQCNAIPTPIACADTGSTQSGLNGIDGYDLVYSPVNLSDILREDTGSVRFDYTPTDKDRFMVRYNINDSDTEDTYGPNQGQVSPQLLRTQLLKLEQTHTFSPTLLNQASLGYTRFFSNTGSDTPKPYYAISGFFTDLGSLPGANSFNQTNAYSTYEFFDNLTKVLHTSNLKFGTQIRVNRQVQDLAPEQSFQFASISDLEHDAPFNLQKIGYAGSLGLHNSEYDFYVQDNWHVTRKLVLNLGLRYDYNTVWNEAHNHAPNFDITSQTFLPGTQSPYTAPRGDLAPRIGVAYDPFGTGKTVFHAYAGLFYLPMWLSFNLASNDPAYASYSVNVFQASFQFPSPNLPLQPGTQTVYSFPQHPKDPNALNWLFGVEQLFPGKLVGVFNYSANRVNHQQAGVNFAAINYNPANPNPNIGTRPLAGFSDENYLGDNLGSDYQSLQVQLRRNYRHLNAQMNYTWSHEIDDMVNVFAGFEDPYDPKLDRSSGDIDVRHNFTASVVYDFADLKDRSTWERLAAGGWQLSSIFQARSGLPENITLISGFFGDPVRPNFVPGQSLYTPHITWVTQGGSYNTKAFSIPTGYDGTYGVNYGDVGRNALRGPGFFQWDFSAMKNFAMTEKAQLQLRADLFNILNHPNYANPDGGICSSLLWGPAGTTAGCLTNPNFGVTASTVANQTGNGAIGNGTSRQAQFSVKVLF
jgi:hypothetical protein